MAPWVQEVTNPVVGVSFPRLKVGASLRAPERKPNMRKIILGIVAATFASSTAYAAADAVKKCCCDDMKKAEQSQPKK